MSEKVVKLIRKTVYGDITKSLGYKRHVVTGQVVGNVRRALYQRAKRDYTQLSWQEKTKAHSLMLKKQLEEHPRGRAV